MKSLVLILSLLTLTQLPSFGQNGSCANPIFEMDFSGPGRNCNISCGKIFNTAIWVVLLESGQDTTTCWLWSDDINLPQSQCSQPGNVTEVNIPIDQLGSPTPYVDYLRNIIQCDGVNMIDDTIYGGPLWPGNGSNVTIMTYAVPCAYPSVLKIYIQIRSTDPQNGFKVFAGHACGAQCYVPVILPIKLSPLKGSLVDNQAHFNIDVFDSGIEKPSVMLESSEDGRSFSEVEASYSIDEETYNFVYNDPSNRYPYYRVRAIDDNGESSYSNIVYLYSNDLPDPFVVTPNPVHAGELINIKGVDKITSANLFDVQGGFAMDCTEYLQDTTKAGHALSLPSFLAKGLYILEVQSAGNGVYRNSLVVQ